MSKEVILSLSKAKGDFVVKTARSSGSGGQNVNKRDTKAQITHPASGARGECQTHRTQEQNKAEAFSRLITSDRFQTWLRIELAKRGIKLKDTATTGPTGMRGEKVRTYNLVRDTVVDHRAGFSVRGVQHVLDGNIDEIVASLKEKADG